MNSTWTGDCVSQVHAKGERQSWNVTGAVPRWLYSGLVRGSSLFAHFVGGVGVSVVGKLRYKKPRDIRRVCMEKVRGSRYRQVTPGGANVK